MDTIIETRLPSVTLLKRGKVRDLYALDDRLVIVATDRISAFDVVLPTPVPDKGYVLTKLSEFWFARTADIVPNHLLTADARAFPPALAPVRDLLGGRSMLVRRARPLPVECIVRGYLAGSAWQEYRTSGTVCGQSLPRGLVEAAPLSEPIFTPSTKAEAGAHDENIGFAELAALVGEGMARQLRDLSLAVYRRAAAVAAARGIIVADTKLEFGIDEATGRLLLIDELLTPDSSRFWPVSEYTPGFTPPSFDKQFVRDYLDSRRWNRRAPAPPLPVDVVFQTRARYLEALDRLTGLARPGH